MQATTKQEAKRIAYFGAKKMDQAGYRYEQLDIWNWWVSSPHGGGYNVSLFDSGDTHCGCKFFEENAVWGTCKHILRIQWLVKEETAEIARREEEYQIAEDATRFMEGCRAERGQ